MSQQKSISVLVISHQDSVQEIAESELKDQKFRVIQAKKPDEARLKFAHEDFDLILIDIDMPSLKVMPFIQNVRRKENLRNIKGIKPILVLGSNPEEFTKDISTIDHTKFLQTPFDSNALRQKVNEFGIHTKSNDVIANNTRQVAKDEFLIEEGGKSLEMYWVLSGSFSVTKTNQDGTTVIIGKAFSGELVGEMSFLDNLPRSASVKALEDSEVLVIPHKKFISVMEGQPRWFRSLMQTLSQRLRNANKLVAVSQAGGKVEDYVDEAVEDEAIDQIKVDI